MFLRVLVGSPTVIFYLWPRRGWFGRNAFLLCTFNLPFLSYVLAYAAAVAGPPCHHHLSEFSDLDDLSLALESV